MAKAKFEFEKAMARAEQIAKAIEQGEIGLEESIKQFEEGMALIKQCRRVLDDAELKIQQLEASAKESADAQE
ncbi:MAG: exodeoxyribonuclease VII small subunit [Phycisphaerales bacterium]|nr:exodeoxyribonuclease VII small subunit [Phycisphaerales bacterium]